MIAISISLRVTSVWGQFSKYSRIRAPQFGPREIKGRTPNHDTDNIGILCQNNLKALLTLCRGNRVCASFRGRKWFRSHRCAGEAFVSAGARGWSVHWSMDAVVYALATAKLTGCLRFKLPMQARVMHFCDPTGGPSTWATISRMVGTGRPAESKGVQSSIVETRTRYKLDGTAGSGLTLA